MRKYQVEISNNFTRKPRIVEVEAMSRREAQGLARSQVKHKFDFVTRVSFADQPMHEWDVEREHSQNNWGLRDENHL